MTETLPTISRRGVVPYIATWSKEEELPSRIIERPGGGIGFADEVAADRDRNGILWVRMSARPGQGRPRFAVIHSLRQRRAMRRLLCQVCAQPADRNSDGMLWVLPDCAHDREGWPQGSYVPEPPMCRSCAPIATRLCPALREGYVAVRARIAPISGVKGLTYRSARPAPVIVRDELIDFGSPAIRWTLAEQLLRNLVDCTMVNLD